MSDKSTKDAKNMILRELDSLSSTVKDTNSVLSKHLIADGKWKSRLLGVLGGVGFTISSIFTLLNFVGKE